MLYTEISSDLQIHFKPTQTQNESIHKQIKTPGAYVSLEKGNINRMLSERWHITKWIKYVVAQQGSAHPSGWNVKINLRIKKSFFQPIMNFPPKVLGADSILYMAIKRSTRVHKSRHRELQSEWIVMRHISDKIKDHWCPTNSYQNQHTTQSSPRHFHHKTQTAHSLLTHVSLLC